MKHLSNLRSVRIIFVLSLFGFFCNAQDIQVQVLGGSTVSDGSTVAISAGNTISFRITNIRTDCEKVKIESISITNTTDFSLSTDKVPKNVDSPDCKGNNNNIDFTITNISGNCGASTDILIEVKKDPDFFFTFSISGNPEINLLGGSPSANILNGSVTTGPTNGTYFGVVDEGNTVTRNYIIANTGSCPLSITSITSSSTDFVVPTSPGPYVLLPNNSPSFLTASVAAGSYVILPVTFIAPVAGSGTLTSTISISNTANTVFTFNVSAEMFNYNIPGPGGITADFRLWLKSTRGVTKSNSKVSQWSDIGTNGKHAIQPISSAQPTYLDDEASNINFNPVIKFENDGSAISQYLYNLDNGFYNQDIFIVMEPDEDVTSSIGMTIFSGSISDIITPENYVDDADDVTGIGLGNYTTNLTGERLWYNQGSSAANPFYALPASSIRTYNTSGIINAGNKTTTASDGMRILFNSVDDALSSTQTITSFQNVGYIDTVAEPDITYGTPYYIGKNTNSTLGNLNGRVAEIFTFAERVSDADRHKIESYLAIKYGITLGSSNMAQKDYINSFGTKVWDITANSGYNYHVTGIGKDSISDLNQKQSKTLNSSNEVTIGLNGVFATNNLNINEFSKDGDFLVWGSNNDAYLASGSNTITIAPGITTSVTRILRQWKIVESTEDVNSDVENIEISIPMDAFSSFALSADEEYVLIVADDDAFANGDIIDVVPLKFDGIGNLKTWYDFDGIKYFTFGKAPKLSKNHSIHIDSGDYLVGEYDLNLNANDFTISAWVKADASQTSIRTIMAKGSKFQLRLNSSHQIEVMLDDDITPRFITSMALNDNKWHQITFVYVSGTIYLYVDGVLDKSEQNVVAPSPNYNRFSIGAVYIDKNNIINPFLGKIDEVYIWDQGLTEDQVHYLMNQEVEKGAGDFVTGKIIPQSSSSNEVAMMPWSKLKAYYDFNSFYGTTIEGLADNGYFLRINYLAKNKNIVENQTTPVPYISANDGAWDSDNTWSNSQDQNIPNSLSLDGVTIIDWNIVQIGHNITSGDRDIYLLGLIQTAGTLTVADPNDAQDETNSGQGLVIINYLELDGVIDLVGESQLVQTDGSILDADSGGYIERDQQGTANSFNYNYWSSSVSPIGGNTSTRGTGISSTNPNYNLAGVLNDGTSSSSYQGLTYGTSAFAADSSTPTTPKTISAYWLYKFYGPSDSYSSWTKINHLSSLRAGEGFTMKGTSGSTALSDYQNYVFKGLPNNGDISLPLNKISGGDVERLIGNPYPSAIDAVEFILDNLSVADGGNNTNGTIFNGALYFWDHFGEQNSHVLKDYVGGYATYSLIGGAVAISNDTRIDANLSTGSKVPGQYIPVNQGFFVYTVVEGFENDNGVPIATVNGGNIVFKNSQRVFAPEDGSSSLFLKPSIRRKVTTRERDAETSKQIAVNNPLIRLVYDSPQGYHRQLVVGTNHKASNKFDIGYDALMVDVNQEDMYWVIDGGKFVIQGVGDFDASQELSLGLIVKKAGMARIQVDALENIDPKLDVYIKDGVTNEVFRINDKPFEIQLEPGTYNDRFKLVFQASETSETSQTYDEVAIDNTISVFYNSEISELRIINKHHITLSEVMLYNMLGQNKKTIRLNSSEDVSIPISPDSGIHIVKLNTTNGVVNKKINVE
ncbi:LamG-like jellyroll fold domain-containing protein [Confluentibacter citreus]|uniref:LamG-like jellyroll fold domain-containing protein n=1 Tax=Confluentibacter citreus TaxID=2007307 RepID=UPI000C282530|nr:LamG-like jellyroll fold domain-containing protein [Confluentibacter citreus]